MICLECGRVLNRDTEITPNMRASIVNRIERLGGPDSHVLQMFRAFFGYGLYESDWKDEERRLNGEEVEYQCCPGEAERLYRGVDAPMNSAGHENEGPMARGISRRLALFSMEEGLARFREALEPDAIESWEGVIESLRSNPDECCDRHQRQD